MAEKVNLVLSDKSVIPTDDLIFTLIGERKILWKKIIAYATENYKDISSGWNYYNDGKQWLFKLVQKKKTIFWGGIFEDTFRITFYFGDKAESLIDGSDLPLTIKEGFKTAKRYGLIRAISVKVVDSSDVDSVLKLIVIKHMLK